MNKYRLSACYFQTAEALLKNSKVEINTSKMRLIYILCSRH